MKIYNKFSGDLILDTPNLREADLYGANLRGTNLYAADLYGANLREADLYGANLREADLREANLCGANLYAANLCGANLRGADLRGADLRGADLRGADLRGADLRGADLREANLYEANLYEANLYAANLRGANLCGANFANTILNLQCPESGKFIAFKKLQGKKIAKIEITEDAKRSSATSRKCRCSKAKVLEITSLDGKEVFNDGTSDRDCNFIYKVGEFVEVDDFDEYRWNECSTGIHFFITRKEAVEY